MVARFAILLLLAVGAFAQPRRIVSTAPSITEMLYALGLGDRVVGVTTFCHYPPEAARKPKIGNYLRPDVEAILALRPDLVIAEKSMVQQAMSLPRLKLNVLEVDDSTVQGIYESIRTIGRSTGAAAKAEAVSGGIQKELESIRQRSARLPRVRVLFVVGRTPGRIEDLIAAGSSSYLNEVMEIAGGRNVLGDARHRLRQSEPRGGAVARPGRHHRYGRDGSNHRYHRRAEEGGCFAVAALPQSQGGSDEQGFRGGFGPLRGARAEGDGCGPATGRPAAP